MSIIAQMLVSTRHSQSSPQQDATWNPTDKGLEITLSNGNLTESKNGSVFANTMARSTIGKSSGKWYWEVSGVTMNGIANASAALTYPGSDINGWGYHPNGTKYNAATGTAYGSSFTGADIMGIALDMDAGTVQFYKNNIAQGVAFTGLTGTIYASANINNAFSASCTANFGATPFAYAVPSGFNAGLY